MSVKFLVVVAFLPFLMGQSLPDGRCDLARCEVRDDQRVVSAVNFYCNCTTRVAGQVYFELWYRDQNYQQRVIVFEDNQDVVVNYPFPIFPGYGATVCQQQPPRTGCVNATFPAGHFSSSTTAPPTTVVPDPCKISNTTGKSPSSCNSGTSLSFSYVLILLLVLLSVLA